MIQLHILCNILQWTSLKFVFKFWAMPFRLVACWFVNHVYRPHQIILILNHSQKGHTCDQAWPDSGSLSLYLHVSWGKLRKVEERRESLGMRLHVWSNNQSCYSTMECLSTTSYHYNSTRCFLANLSVNSQWAIPKWVIQWFAQQLSSMVEWWAVALKCLWAT